MELFKFSRKPLIENRWLKFVEDEYELPNGKKCTYHHVQQCEAIMIIAIESINNELSTFIVNQYRHPIGKAIWQFPLGGFFPSEQSPIEAAKKELQEETGLCVGQVHYKGSFYANPAFTNQKIHVCISSDIVSKTEPCLEDSEYGLISKKVNVKDILGLIESGEMDDAWGITGFHYMNLYIESEMENRP